MLRVTAAFRQSFLAVFCLALLQTSCRESGLPAIGSKRYADFISAFSVGVAGLQTGEDMRARLRLTEATVLAPGEPASWANLALLSVRQQDFDAAFGYADKARKLAPQNSRIEELLGAIESRRGKIAESLADYRKAVELDGNNLKALYSLAEQTERQGSPQDESAAQSLLEQLLSKEPRNVAVQIDILRLAAKRGDNESATRMLNQLKAESASWPPEAQSRLATISPNGRAASVQAVFLRNLLIRDPAYRRNLEAIKTPVTFVADPFLVCLRLKNPDSHPASPDTALSFLPAESKASSGVVTWAGAVSLDGGSKLTVVTAGPAGLAIGDAPLLHSEGSAPGRNGVLALDLDYDYKMDFVVASASGVKIYHQRAANDFEDISSRSKIPPAVLHGNFTGAYAFDVDLDGDLDVVLGTRSGEPIVLRNNGDLTFNIVQPFKNVDGLVSFSRADIDGDGDPDVAIVDAHGKVHLFSNERLGAYREVSLTTPANAAYVASATAKVTGEGSLLSFVLLSSDGALDKVIPRTGSSDWQTERFVRPAGAPLKASNSTLIPADFDNNGASDFLISGGRLLLGDGNGFSPVSLPKEFSVFGTGDLNGDGRVDILAAAPDGNLALLANHGSKNYGWQTILPRAANARGDQRINSFGIGGEVEIRAGLLNQKQPIDSPVVHFGLGNQKQTDVARIVWPNGAVQAEFELASDAVIRAQQRLKGSCPSLFAWNGHEIKFVKDSAPWSAALGLHINAQTVAQVNQTEEWFKIPAESLQPKNNQYDLRVTAELWETFYIDHYALQAVDHPEGTEIYTDERCSMPPPPLKIYTVSEPRPFASAIDDGGSDVSEIVRGTDGQYLDTFGRGRYQGVTRDHWVELELPADAPKTDKLLLIASGWLHPTDATVNIALGQNSDPRPQPLHIEVLDRHSQWMPAGENLGFLAGKLKTAVIPIGHLLVDGAPRKLRLRTNMEIYWDQLSWTVEIQQAGTRTQPLAMTKAELEYRGFSRMDKANTSSPEIPDYEHLEGTAQKWRDLEGYYTRFGDVRPLLASTDDHYVIQNAGDELRLAFAVCSPPPKGWKRDFVMIGDGWVKDGDYNTVFSKTVEPLPHYGILDPKDWELFHTRYVTPDSFTRGLWN